MGQPAVFASFLRHDSDRCPSLTLFLLPANVGEDIQKPSGSCRGSFPQAVISDDVGGQHPWLSRTWIIFMTMFGHRIRNAGPIINSIETTITRAEY
jgi:hypothetical protein